MRQQAHRRFVIDDIPIGVESHVYSFEITNVDMGLFSPAIQIIQTDQQVRHGTCGGREDKVCLSAECYQKLASRPRTSLVQWGLSLSQRCDSNGV